MFLHLATTFFFLVVCTQLYRLPYIPCCSLVLSSVDPFITLLFGRIFNCALDEMLDQTFSQLPLLTRTRLEQPLIRPTSILHSASDAQEWLNFLSRVFFLLSLHPGIILNLGDNQNSYLVSLIPKRVYITNRISTVFTQTTGVILTIILPISINLKH